jgi:alpha-galactosidase
MASLRPFPLSRVLVLIALFTLLDLTANHPCIASPSPFVRVQHEAGMVRVTTPYLELNCDLRTGRWGAQWLGMAGPPAIYGADSAVILADGTSLTASGYSTHVCTTSDVTPIKDAFGMGTQIIIAHLTPGRLLMRQVFRIYSNHPYFFVRLEIRGPLPLSTNDISPVVLNGAPPAQDALDLGRGERPRTLFVPYDNDNFVRYSSDYATTSHEVTAVYDNANRHGFVLGSVTHDLWKTGIQMGASTPHSLASLRIYGGATGPDTHDTQPHGFVSGKTVSSPQIFIGYFLDWRGGMRAYGHANALVCPPLVWHRAVPFGWNSWAAYMATVNGPDYLAASGFIKSSLSSSDPNVWKNAFVNFDSFWDNLSDTQLAAVVRQVHATGQKAGIYWTPFVYWGSDLKQTVEGTGGRYTYQDIVLKDASGRPLPTLDGAFALDPSHPGTLQRIDWECSRFVSLGFDFIKLDFMSHGAREGAHFDPHITTGTAAYNLGMARLDADLSPAKIGRPFFISLSIAPLFPAGYADSRRISCDTFGAISNTEYMLNSLTYAWWEGGSIYAFNDGDHAVLYQAHGQPITSYDEGLSRLNATVVAGSLVLDSDDLTNVKAQERVRTLLGNQEVMALARVGKPFLPVEGDTGTQATDTFVRQDPISGACYVGVFNYSPSAPVTKQIVLARLGLNPQSHYRVYDLWTHRKWSVQGRLTLTLNPAASTLLRLTRISP